MASPSPHGPNSSGSASAEPAPAPAAMGEGKRPPLVGPPKPRPTYAQNWTPYNQAQTQEALLVDDFLMDLLQLVPEPQRSGPGRPAMPLRERIFCAVRKVYANQSSRRAVPQLLHAVQAGFLSNVRHFNTASKLLNDPALTPMLHDLIALSATPLRAVETRFAIDSTGFRSTSFNAYHQTKHGERKEHQWLKAHVCVGTRSHIVTRVVVTEANKNDSPQFEPLLKETHDLGFHIERITADKAYSSRANHDAAGDVGAEAFIPFKSNATGRAGGSPLWRKAYHHFQLHREEFDVKYHDRSNVEAAFGALKRKLGETLRSRDRVAQENEILAKILVYNLTVLVHEMFEENVEPDFSGRPSLVPAAKAAIPATLALDAWSVPSANGRASDEPFPGSAGP
jgi:transposase